MEAPWKIQDKIFSAQLLAFETPCLPKPLLYIKVDGKLRIEKEKHFPHPIIRLSNVLINLWTFFQLLLICTVQTVSNNSFCKQSVTS